MKYFLNIIWAFILTYLVWTLVAEYATSETAQKFSSWIYKIPFYVQVLMWWTLFSFPKGSSQLFLLIVNSIKQGAAYTVFGIGNLFEHVWKYRAGKITIGGASLFLLYYFIFKN